jgi:hypothetical protein
MALFARKVAGQKKTDNLHSCPFPVCLYRQVRLGERLFQTQVSSLTKLAVVVFNEQHNSSAVYYVKYQVIRCQPCQRQG